MFFFLNKTEHNELNKINCRWKKHWERFCSVGPQSSQIWHGDRTVAKRDRPTPASLLPKCKARKKCERVALRSDAQTPLKPSKCNKKAIIKILRTQALTPLPPESQRSVSRDPLPLSGYVVCARSLMNVISLWDVSVVHVYFVSI